MYIYVLLVDLYGQCRKTYHIYMDGMGYCNGLNFTISQASMNKKCEQFGRINQDNSSWKRVESPDNNQVKENTSNNLYPTPSRWLVDKNSSNGLSLCLSLSLYIRACCS